MLLGPFSLSIVVLNLQRESHLAEEDRGKEEIGSGSFGTVSVVKLKDRSYAVKRIPFLYKFKPEGDYDYEENKGKQQQLKRCLK